MRLHWSPRSPFVRKVMVVAHELGIAEQIELERSVAAMTRPNPQIMADNPLSKIPTLVLDDGSAIFDSGVIVEYLDSLHGHMLIPSKGAGRWKALTHQSLGDGFLDLLVLWRNERDKPEQMVTKTWCDAFAIKAEAVLNHFDLMAAELTGGPFGIAQIAIGCALSYADFRFEDIGWRNGRDALAAWHANFSRRPSMIATEIEDA